MTLRITRVVDEMIDLEEGKQYSHGIFVSNGQREEFIPLSQSSLAPLIVLYAETLSQPQQTIPQNGAQTPAPPAPPPEARRSLTELAAGVPSATVPPAKMQPTAPQLIDPRNEVFFTPNEEPEEEEEFEPGEEYEDELTGVQSY